MGRGGGKWEGVSGEGVSGDPGVSEEFKWLGIHKARLGYLGTRPLTWQG